MADDEQLRNDEYGFDIFAKFLDGLSKINAPTFWEAAKMAKAVQPDGDKWFARVINRISPMQLESPIEAIFAMHWMVAEAQQPELEEIVTCFPHYAFRQDGELFRPDFTVGANVMPYEDMVSRMHDQVIVVELDGHDFHERTKQQVAARNRKDRAIQRRGWAVCHFSGSEIVGDPDECVRHVLDLAQARGQFDLGREAAARRRREGH